MEITIKIDAPGLETAMQDLAQALRESGTVEAPPVKKVAEKPVKKEAPKKEAAKKTEPEPEPDAAEEETEETASGLTFEQVRVKLAEVSQKGKQKELKALISSFGVAKLSDIPEEKYAELLEKAADL